MDVQYLIPCKTYNVRHIKELSKGEKVERLMFFYSKDVNENDKKNLIDGKSFVKFICDRKHSCAVYCKYICNLNDVQQSILLEYQKENPGQIVGEFSEQNKDGSYRGVLFTIDPSEFD